MAEVEFHNRPDYDDLEDTTCRGGLFGSCDKTVAGTLKFALPREYVPYCELHGAEMKTDSNYARSWKEY